MTCKYFMRARDVFDQLSIFVFNCITILTFRHVRLFGPYPSLPKNFIARSE